MFLKQPNLLADIRIHKNITDTLHAYIQSEDFPHFLLYGPSGTGKTTIANCFINEFLGNTKMYNCLSLNASNTRGIEMVREQIDEFAKHKAINKKFRIVLLDEADYLTQDAKAALRGIMENNKSNCKFILTCNAIEKIGAAILSRCAKFNVRALSLSETKQLLSEIATENDIKLSEEHISKLIENANGDIRYLINNLASNPSEIYNRYEITKELIRSISEHSFSSVIFKYKLPPTLVIEMIFNYIQNKDFSFEKYTKIIEKLASTDYKISLGCNEYLQLDYLGLELKDLIFD